MLAGAPSSAPRPAWLAPWVLGIVLAQGFHMLEHVLQMVQAYVLRAPHAHGLLGQHFDTDLLHLAFNAALLAAFAPVARLGGDARLLSWQFFLGALVAQSYHVVEHSVKAWQSMALGHDPALGIAGHWGPLIPIHFWFNAVVALLAAPHLVRLLRGPWRSRSPAPAAARSS